MRILTVVVLALALFLDGCDVQKADESIGSIERLGPRLDELIPRDARLEKLAEDF